MPDAARSQRSFLRKIAVVAYIVVVTGTAMFCGGALAVIGFATLAGDLETAASREPAPVDPNAVVSLPPHGAVSRHP